MDAQWIAWARKAKKPVAITGAGISVPSGLPTINSSWRGVPLREVFTLTMFTDDPARFYQCFRELLLDWREAKPNPAHLALVKGGVRVITQNIDGLHQEAGAQDVVEMHGNLRELICLHCEELYPSHVAESNPLPHCPSCQHLLKPNIVLVGEEVRHIATATDWVGECDLLLTIGTALEMAPVRELPKIATARGVPIIACNACAEEVLPQLFVSP